MRTRLCLVACAAMALFAVPADAAVWRWGCVGLMGYEHMILNRDTLILLPRMQKISTLEKYVHRDSLDYDANHEGAAFLPEDFNSGFEKTMTYKKNSDGHDKLVLTEKSSRVTFKRDGRAGSRDEIITKFRKVYRFALEGEAPRDITMQCMEYILSTKGGRE